MKKALVTPFPFCLFIFVFFFSFIMDVAYWQIPRFAAFPIHYFHFLFVSSWILQFSF